MDEIAKYYNEQTKNIMIKVGKSEALIDKIKNELENPRLKEKEKEILRKDLERLQNYAENDISKVKQAEIKVIQKANEVGKSTQTASKEKGEEKSESISQKLESHELETLGAVAVLQAVGSAFNPKAQDAIKLALNKTGEYFGYAWAGAKTTAEFLWTKTATVREVLGKGGTAAIRLGVGAAKAGRAVAAATPYVTLYAAGRYIVIPGSLYLSKKYYVEPRSQESEFNLKMGNKMLELAKAGVKYEDSKIRLQNVAEGLTFGSYVKKFEAFGAKEVVVLLNSVPENKRGDVAVGLTIAEKTIPKAYSEDYLNAVKDSLETAKSKGWP